MQRGRLEAGHQVTSFERFQSESRRDLARGNGAREPVRDNRPLILVKLNMVIPLPSRFGN